MKHSFGKFDADFQRQLFLKRFAILELILIKLQAFFYRTTFSAKSGMYWRQSHRILSRTPLKTRVKPQKQPLQLFYTKRCPQKFPKFNRETFVLKSLFNLSIFSQNAGKYGPEKSPYLDTFHAVFCITIYSFVCQFSLHN